MRRGTLKLGAWGGGCDTKALRGPGSLISRLESLVSGGESEGFHVVKGNLPLPFCGDLGKWKALPAPLTLMRQPQ